MWRQGTLGRLGTLGEDSRVTDNDTLHQEMLAGIGNVAMNSGHASQAVQQMIEVVSGTGLIYFIMRDAPLGSQVKDARTMVAKAGTNEWIRHPPVDIEVRDLILKTLGALGRLVDYRNRIIHDIWWPAPTNSQPKGIHGNRATRWGKETVTSNVKSLHQVANTFFLVAATLGAAERALVDLRRLGDSPASWQRTDAMRELLGYDRDLTARMTSIETGTLDGWLWVKTPYAH